MRVRCKLDECDGCRYTMSIMNAFYVFLVTKSYIVAAKYIIIIVVLILFSAAFSRNNDNLGLIVKDDLTRGGIIKPVTFDDKYQHLHIDNNGKSATCTFISRF